MAIKRLHSLDHQVRAFYKSVILIDTQTMGSGYKKKVSFSKVNTGRGSLNQPLMEGVGTALQHQNSNPVIQEQDFFMNVPQHNNLQSRGISEFDQADEFFDKIRDEKRNNINVTQSIKEGDIINTDEKQVNSMIKNTVRNDSADTRVDLDNTSTPRNMSMVQPGTIIENKPLTE